MRTPSNHPIILYDDNASALAPLSDLRPSFCLRVGPRQTHERIADSYGAIAGLVVPDTLEALTKEQLSIPTNTDINIDGSTPVLAINGRCPLPSDAIRRLEPGRRVVERSTGDTIALCAPFEQVVDEVRGDVCGLTTVVDTEDRTLISRPWHARSFRDQAIAQDLEHLSKLPSKEFPPQAWKLGEHTLRVDPEATIYPAVTFDCELGPVVIDKGVSVRPGATISGPAYIGQGSTVLDNAVIRPNTSIGPVCKVGGEIGGTVFQGHANKAHDGYLGDAWVGEWVNLGAATTNSNLLNTYGEIVAKRAPGAPNERTGEHFLGAVIGDHVKTAIGTLLMTGCVLHTGSMFAQSTPVSGAIAPFTWATDKGHTPYRLEKFIDVMRAVMARRNVDPSDAYIQRLRRISER